VGIDEGKEEMGFIDRTRRHVECGDDLGCGIERPMGLYVRSGFPP
jgi:hypothetical protein